MKQIRKFAALILAFSVLFSLAVPTFAASSVQSEVQSSAAFMLSSVKSPEVGSIGGEWAVIGLARSGYSVPADYYDEYPFEFSIDLPGVNYDPLVNWQDASADSEWIGERAQVALGCFFRIPVLQDEYIELGIDKNMDGTGSGRMMSLSASMDACMTPFVTTVRFCSGSRY